MEIIIDTLKKLYRGENVVKKHLCYLSLFILPCMTGGILSYIDKDTPNGVILGLVLVAAFVACLSILPSLYSYGFNLTFYNGRFNNSEGIPAIDNEMLKKAVKALPLFIVWSLYAIFFGLFLLLVPALPIIFSVPFIKTNIGLFILSILVTMILYCIAFIVLFLIVPFLNYIYISYSENYEYSPELFNPLIIVDFIKKSFKNTVITALKYYVANMVTGFAASCICMIFIMLLFILGIIAGIILPESDNAIYNPVFITIAVLISTAAMLIQGYPVLMLAFAMNDNLIEIYKSEIRSE